MSPTDPFKLAKESNPERLNALADTIQSSWNEFVPLSVRYAAAATADAVVAEYMSHVSEWSIEAVEADEMLDLLESAGFPRPLRDVGPVPGGSAADGPARFGQDV